MKSGSLVFSVLIVLVLTAAPPAHALMGVDDDVVGYDVLLPYFLVSMPGHGNMNTVIAITETCESSVNFHYFVYPSGGVLQYDSFLPLTVCDVATINANTIMNNMATANRSSFEVDLDGDGTNDHYAGYINFENSNTSAPKNQVTAMAYFLDLPKGISTGMNLPVREVDESLLITDPKLVNLTRHTEYFSANALFRAQQYIGLRGTAGTVTDAGFCRLLPRFFLIDSESVSYFFIWSSTACPALHVNVYNTEENFASVNLPALNAGLNIINIEGYLPNGLFPSYPKEGWIDIRMPDIFSAGFEGDREMLGYVSSQIQVSGPGVCGDTNGDGVVDIGDAMYIAQYLVHNRESLSCVGSSDLFFLSMTQMQKDVGP